ncbi:MAG: cation transporter [Alphaproteobacteria bacterium]|jgi:Co/Zn/Cd efflux system component|nr:cation transporter [Alphaproteobacteria bacterium]
MVGCCGSDDVAFDGMSAAYRRILWTVIAINGVMFGVETFAGHNAGSQALKADALDFLADSLTYGVSLWAIGRSGKTRALAALAKGVSLALMGLWVLGSTAYQVMVLGVPEASLMGAVGLLACAANLLSVMLLLRYKDGDANVRSVWLCSRNDAIGNLGVVAAAGLVYFTSSGIPDLVVAGAMAGLFCWSAREIIRRSLAELKEVQAAAAPV